MIWILQYLCPARHCVCGVFYLDTAVGPDLAEKAVLAAMKERGYQHQCGLCGSPDLHFEHGKTVWKTMDEAAPHIAATESANLISRAMIEYERQNFRPN